MRRRPIPAERAAASAEMIRQMQQIKPEHLPPVHVVIYQGATSFVKHYPVTSFLYILGLGLMCFCSGLMPSEEASDEYSRLLREADFENNQLDQAELKYAKQNARYQSTRGFLGFSCDATCNREYQKLMGVQQELNQAKAAQFKVMSEAKSKVGVFSMYAVQEARDLFWGSMGQGKAFAKRASMWDLLFVGLGSLGRDEGMVTILFRIALNVLMNFTMGLIGATVAFVWYLWDVIRAYQPDPLTGMLAFAVFTVAAVSMVVTYLMALYGAVGASAYMIVRTAVLSLDNGQAGGARRGPAGHIRHDEHAPREEPQDTYTRGDTYEGGGGGGDEHASWSRSSDSGLRLGMHVKIRGLAARPEYNGQLGVICGKDGERWLVQLQADKSLTLKLKDANLDVQ